MGSPDDCCARVAARQHGCLSATQAVRCGLSHDAVRRRVRARRWRRLLPCIYAFSGSPTTWEQRLWAAVLWGGEGSAVAAASAAAVWRLPDFAPGPVEIAAGAGKRSRDFVVVHRWQLEPVDVTKRRGLSVTTPERTLADLAPRLGRRRFDAAFHHCLHVGMATFDELEAIAARRAGTPGSRLLRDALAAYSGNPPAGSPLEARLTRRLVESNLPEPCRQHEVRLGTRRFYLDFAWPDHLVGLEVDGYRWHSSRTAWEKDRIRIAELRRAGWTVIQATKNDVDAGFARLEVELAQLLSRAS